MSDESPGAVESVPAVIAEHLEIIDAGLAEAQVPLNQRPLRATLELALNGVLEVKDADGRRFKPETNAEVVTQKWFRGLFRTTQCWYAGRYAAALEDDQAERTLRGFVVLWRTAFALSVPASITEPEIPGETVRLEFPDDVRPHEEPLSWLVKPPAIAHLKPEERTSLRSDASEVAARLRAINAAILGIGRRSDDADGLLQSLRLHLDHAASRPVDSVRGGLGQACWDLQMACECALKVLVETRTNTFPRTHDLQELWRQAIPHLTDASPDMMNVFPAATTMIAHRYGGGPIVTLGAYYQMYLTTLRVVSSALAAIRTLKVGNIRLTLAKPPWLR